VGGPADRLAPPQRRPSLATSLTLALRARPASETSAPRLIYAGYFPMGLSLERIMGDMRAVPFKDEVWPKSLRDNARRVLKLDG
jgi:hypothetical protein